MGRDVDTSYGERAVTNFGPTATERNLSQARTMLQTQANIVHQPYVAQARAL